MSNIFAELKRRNVFRVIVAYLAGSWLIIQIVETLFPIFGFGDASVRLAVILLAIGFIPAVALSWVFEVTPEGIRKDRAEGVDRKFAAASAKSLDRAIIIVLALALALFSVDRFVLAPQREAALMEAAMQAGAEQALEAERARAAEIPQDSIAVLPFVNMSGDPQNEYFSDGLTETLLHMLAQLPDLKVSARTSAFAFKGQSVDVRTIAQALGVAHVLEGSVQKAGNRVRITAQLIRADDGFHIWSQHYDRNLDDIFAIQDEIAGEVATTLGSALFAENGIQGVNTSDISTFDIYLHALEQQAINTNESLTEAQRLFREALEKDKDFLDARTALARNYILMQWKNVMDSDIALAMASDLTTEVLAQRPDDLAAMGLKLVARVVAADRAADLGTANDAFEELLPLMDAGYGDSYVRRFAVESLVSRGRHEEALTVLRDGLVVDPLNYDLLWAQADILTETGRLEEALQPLLTARKLAPDNPLIYWRLSELSFKRGETVEGLNWLRQASEADPADPVLKSILGSRFYWLGLLQEGDYWLERTLAIEPAVWQTRMVEISAAVARGDQDQLLELVTETIDRSLAGEVGPTLTMTATTYYSYIMRNRGRSQEALDYIAARMPGFDDMNSLPEGWAGIVFKSNLFPLRSDVMDEESFRQMAITFVNTLDAAGIPYRNDRSAAIAVEMWRGGLPTAKIIFRNDFSNLPPDHPWWRTILESPWLAEFREEPEVAARLAEVAREKRKLRDDVLEMLKTQEWQHK